MKMRFGLGLGNPVYGAAPPPPPDPAAEVEALLSGTVGWALDSADGATLWQDTGKVTPAANGQVIGLAETKYGTTTYTFSQATLPSLGGLWTTTAITYDGIDDFLQSAASYSFASSMTAFLLTLRIRPSLIAGATRTVYALSHSTANSTRHTVAVLADGSIQVQARRANGDSPTTLTTATGLVVAGTAYTIQLAINFTLDTIAIYLDGSSVASNTMGGTTGTASDATASARVRFASSLTGTNFFQGNIGRAVFLPIADTAPNRTSCKDYVEAVSI